MKAFKILDTKDDNRMIGFIVAENITGAYAEWEKRCTEMDAEEDYETVELAEMTREEFCAIQLIDETADPDEDGEYPLSDMDYDEEVANVTEAYVIEFDH